MSKILITLPSALKAKLEQHPNYRYGNCNQLYVEIIRRFVESDEFTLVLAKREIRRLNAQIEYLNKDLHVQKSVAEMFKNRGQQAATSVQPGEPNAA